MNLRAAVLPLLVATAPALAADFPVDLATVPRGEIVSGIPALSDAEQTYELYLPKSFDRSRKWPILFLFDPRARGKVAADLFRPAAEEFGWILLSSNNTRSDGPGEPNQRAVNALFPDAFKRLPVDERRIYAGGFSGGAVIAWSVGLVSRGLAGVVSIGGRPEPAHAALSPNFALFSAAGDLDFNYQATRALDAIAARGGVAHRLESYPGPHAWCPPETARRAVLWLDSLAMRDGLAPRDASVIAARFAEEQAAAQALAAGGETLAAARRFREIADTFRGLADPPLVDAAAARAAAISDGAAAKSALREEQAAEDYESQGSRKVGDAMALARGDSLPSAARLRQLVGLDEARRRSVEPNERGRAAARHLEMVAVQLGFYLATELMGKDDYRRALAPLAVAAAAKPADPFARYNLACAQARNGDRKGALESLALAVDNGLPQPERMATDRDLESLRELPEFRALLARIPASAIR
jgi:predicted esterase